MRKLRVSTFSHATDNSAQPYEFLFSDLIRELEKPEISESPPTEEGAQALKLAASAWSPATFENDVRKNSGVKTVSMLVYDLDGKEKQGIETENLLNKVKDLGLSYAVHCTTRSGFCAPKAKVRLIFPLERDVTVAEYLKLWDRYREALDLGDDVDTTRRHPGGIFFSPVIFREHEQSYFCRSASGPFLSVGSGFPSLKDRDESYWIDTVRTAVNKHDALNRAAFAIAQRRARVGKTSEGLEEVLFQALRENQVSEPVLDWTAAARTVSKAIEDGVAAAEVDPRETIKTPEVSQKLIQTAQKKLKSVAREIKQGADLSKAAFTMGRFVPHALSEDEVRKALENAWRKCESSSLAASEVGSIIETSLGAGMAQPAGRFDDWKKELLLDKDGTGFAATEANVQILMRTHPDLDGLGKKDLRRGVNLLTREPPWPTDEERTYPCELLDREQSVIGPWVNKELNVSSASSRIAYECLLHQCEANTFDCFLEYLNSLPKAETTETLDRVLIECFGVQDTEYTHLATRYWFTSIYARQVKPGEKVDTALILSGPQGSKKSTFFRKIFPKEIADLCYTDSIPDWSDKDVHLALERYAVVEISELSSMARKEVEERKAFISSQSSVVREAFRRSARYVPRRTVFSGTTNRNGDFLVDSTGNRRFVPVEIGHSLKDEWLEANRDLIWAQARYYYETAHRWYPTTKEEFLFTEAQEAVTAQEPFFDEISEFVSSASPKNWKTTSGGQTSFGKEIDKKILLLENQGEMGKELNYVTSSQIMEYLEIKEDWKIQNTISRIMQKLRWKTTRIYINGIRQRVWKLT